MDLEEIVFLAALAGLMVLLAFAGNIAQYLRGDTPSSTDSVVFYGEAKDATVVIGLSDDDYCKIALEIVHPQFGSGPKRYPYDQTDKFLKAIHAKRARLEEEYQDCKLITQIKRWLDLFESRAIERRVEAREQERIKALAKQFESNRTASEHDHEP